MHLQRYLLRDKHLGAQFGEYSKEHYYDFNWYFGADKIGILGNLSTEAGQFMGGFLMMEDKLLLSPSDFSPKICRASSPYAVMRGDDGGGKRINDLMQLIQKSDVTHVYLSSIDEHGRFPGILTFSKDVPSSDIYIAGNIMPVVIDTRWSDLDRKIKEMMNQK